MQQYRLEYVLVCRYALLYTFGGFYMDLDIECHKPIDALRAYPFIMPQTRPVGFSNDFLASTPGEASKLHPHPGAGPDIQKQESKCRLSWSLTLENHAHLTSKSWHYTAGE